jgi:hypothetical protein
MEQLFNLSFWVWVARECSPAAMTRAWFAEWQRMRDGTHKKTD